jgi:tRNA1Val (adenine37-N6)-methyltransferase
MKPFRFQKFSIAQSPLVFRVGTDAVLLGSLSSVSSAKNILEIGTGTGIVALMIAQRNSSAKITALDIDPNAQLLAEKNFHNSVFSERLQSILFDFKNYTTSEKFDLIISNPPYFQENSSKKDVVARQLVEMDFRLLLEKSSHLLSSVGKLSIIIPNEISNEIISLALQFGLHLSRQINVKGIATGDCIRVILEFSKRQSSIDISEFVIEKSPRKYSDQYIALTKDFHVFGG